MKGSCRGWGLLVIVVVLFSVFICFNPQVYAVSSSLTLRPAGNGYVQQFVEVPNSGFIWGDQFESGDISAWTTTAYNGGYSGVDVTHVHTGTYAYTCQVSNSYNQLIKNLGTAYATIDVRCYIYNQNVPASGHTAYFVGTNDPTNLYNPVFCYIYNSGGTPYWGLLYQDNSGSHKITSSVVATINTWNCIELSYVQGSGVGSATVYLNNVSIASATGLTNTNMSSQYVVIQANSPDLQLNWFDDVVVSTSYIGLETRYNLVTDQNDNTALQVTASTTQQELEALPNSILRVQQAKGNALGSASTLIVTMPKTPTSGNLLIMCFGSWDNGIDISSITETNVTWSYQTNHGWNANGISSIWAGVVSAGASSTITVNLNGQTSAFGSVAYVCEYSGLLTSGFLDKTAGNDSYPTSTSTVTTGVTGVTAQANELCIGCIMFPYYGQTTPVNGYALVDGSPTPVSAPYSISVAYLEKIVNAIGTTYTGTTSTSNPWCACIATFKAAPSNYTYPITSVEVHMRAKASTTGCNATTLAYTYGTLYTGNAISISNGAFTDYSTTYTTNPATNVSWTWAEVNSLTIGAQATTLTSGNTIQFSEFYINVNFQVSVNITFTSTTVGSGFIWVNNSAVTTPYTIMANVGDVYNVSANNPANLIAGQTRYAWLNWNDSGAQTHSITVPSSNTTYLATFQLQYCINATSDANMVIFPSSLWVNASGSQTFTYSANSGYNISSCYVDGYAVLPSGTYTFSNVATWHSINVFSQSATTSDEVLGVAVVFGMMGISLAVAMPILFMRRRLGTV